MNMATPGMADADDSTPRRKRGARARLKKDWGKPVADIFFTPGLDAGFHTIGPVPWTWRACSNGRIAAASASGFAAITAEIDSCIQAQESRRTFRRAIEINTVLARADHVELDGSAMALDGKWLLNGAGGTRLRSKFRYANEDNRPSFDEDLEEAMSRTRDTIPAPLPTTGMPGEPCDLVLDCRNFTNFYHFLTESLPQLTLAAQIPKLRRIVMHTKKPERAGFVTAWIKALFPELAPKVEFQTGEHRFTKACIAYNFRHFYYQSNDAVMPPVDHLGPKGNFWAKRRGLPLAEKLLEMNSVDASIVALRARALEAITGRDWSHLPRRIYVARATTGLRDRTMKGEDKLIPELESRGFTVVHFEKLTPLEQVAIMARAEIVVSYHGAGFANMMFAGPETRVVEFGTLQTAMFRWRDFIPLAHVSGCRYISLFADFKQADPSTAPDLRSLNLVPVALGTEGRNLALRYLDAVIGVPETMAADDLRRVAVLLNQSEDWGPLATLLERHPADTQGDPDHLIMQGNCAEHAGDHETAFASLEKAWRMSMNRPFLLERLILLADQIGMARAMHDLRAEHQERYKHRHQDLLKRLRRLRRKREMQEAP